MTLICGRCGRRPDAHEAESDAAPERWSPAFTTEASPGALAPMVCAACVTSTAPLGFCNRCGNETPEAELLSSGRCEWCRSADVIPYEEPEDDSWWDGKTTSAGQGNQP